VNLLYISFFLIGQEEEECESPPVLPSVRELKHKFRVSNPDLKTQVKFSERKKKISAVSIVTFLLYIHIYIILVQTRLTMNRRM
jgi:hypothetical protein